MLDSTFYKGTIKGYRTVSQRSISNIFLWLWCSSHHKIRSKIIMELDMSFPNELSLLPVSGPWCADRVFCHAHYKRPSQNGTGVPQLWVCARNQSKSIKSSWELFLYLSEVSFSCETRTDGLHKHVWVIETHLKYYRRGLFYGLFMHEAVSLWRGCLLSHHAIQDAWRLRVSDTCGIYKRVIPGPQSRWKTFM